MLNQEGFIAEYPYKKVIQNRPGFLRTITENYFWLNILVLINYKFYICATE
jgi:hypothetical protein